MTPSPPSISKTSFLSPQGETLGPLSNDCIPLPSRRPVTSSPVSVNLAAVETSRGWNHTVSVLSCPACCPSRASKVRPCSAPGRPYFPRPGPPCVEAPLGLFRPRWARVTFRDGSQAATSACARVSLSPSAPTTRLRGCGGPGASPS